MWGSGHLPILILLQGLRIPQLLLPPPMSKLLTLLSQRFKSKEWSISTRWELPKLLLLILLEKQPSVHSFCYHPDAEWKPFLFQDNTEKTRLSDLMQFHGIAPRKRSLEKKHHQKACSSSPCWKMENHFFIVTCIPTLKVHEFQATTLIGQPESTTQKFNKVIINDVRRGWQMSLSF